MAVDILTSLQTRRDNILTELATFSPKASYAIDGQSVQWESYRKSLIDELESIQNLINMYFPFEIATVAV